MLGQEPREYSSRYPLEHVELDAKLADVLVLVPARQKYWTFTMFWYDQLFAQFYTHIKYAADQNYVIPIYRI